MILSDSIKNCEGSKTDMYGVVLHNQSLHSKNCEGSKTERNVLTINVKSLHSKNCEGSKTVEFDNIVIA